MLSKTKTKNVLLKNIDELLIFILHQNYHVIVYFVIKRKEKKKGEFN